MDEVKNTKIYETLLEAHYLIYTLRMALDNQEQPINDTTPYSEIARMIERKIGATFEIVKPEN